MPSVPPNPGSRQDCRLKQKSLIFPEKSLLLFTMTENDNQKLDLIMKMIEQHDRRFDQIEESRREDRAEMGRRFEQAEMARKEDRAEWQKAREEDRAEMVRRFEQAEMARKEDRAEWQKAREEDRAEMARRFDQIERRLERIEDNQVSEKKRLDEVYEARERVKITFGWQWGMASMFIAIVAAGITKIFS